MFDHLAIMRKEGLNRLPAFFDEVMLNYKPVMLFMAHFFEKLFKNSKKNTSLIMKS